MPSATSRRGDIQGLRALAVIMVVAFHAGLPVPGGFVGVDVFFVISGYVITRMLLTELHGTGGLALGTFYLRRIRRILPALAVLLVGTLGLSVLLAPIGGQEVTARTGAAAAYFNANTYLILHTGGYFAVKANVNALLHTWSLSVEEQFYLVFPALLLGAWAFARRTRSVAPARAVALALAAIVVVSFFVSWMLTMGKVGPFPFADSAPRIAFYSAPTRAWEFAIGGLVAYCARPISRLGRTSSLACAMAGVAAIAWAAFAIDAQSRFPGVVALVPVIGTALVIAAGERAGSTPVSRALAIRPAQRIGDLSYSWYLWHWPLIVFASALWPGADAALVVVAVLSLVPAWLSLRYVENPIRFRARPPTRRTLTLAGFCIVVPIAAAVGLLRAHDRLLRTDPIQEFAAAFQGHADLLRGCDNDTPFVDHGQPACEWTVARPTGHVVLIGDSNAGHFTEGLTRGAKEAGWDATVRTKSSCPFVDLVPIPNHTPALNCRAFVTDSVQGLIDADPDLVVIASSSDTYLSNPDWEFGSPNGRQTFRTPAEKAAAWAGGLERVVRPLRDHGIEVVVVHPVPKFGDWDPNDCAVIRWLRDRASCGRTLATATMLRDEASAATAEQQAARATGSETMDLSAAVCPGARCSALRDGVWRWRNGDHISVPQSELLADRFGALLRRHPPSS